jgi:hypothetical protein
MKAKSPSAARDAQLASDWKWLESRPEGQRIIADIMVWCGVYNQIDETDPVKMALQVGENNFAKRILGLLAYSPREFTQRAKEHADLLDRMMRNQD